MYWAKMPSKEVVLVDNYKNDINVEYLYRAIMMAQTPEECYSHWYSRIKPGHEGAVNAMVEAMAQNPNKVFQTIYPWIHPALGEITVRCTGKCVHNENGVTVFEGFHRNMSEVCETYTNIEDTQ